LKIVLDSNVVIAAFAARGLCHAVFELCIGDHDVILSEPLMDEVEAGFSKKIKLPKSVVVKIVEFLKSNSRVEIPAMVPANICRDPGDRHVLGLADVSQADYIISGDGDLLALGTFKKTTILSPREFWEILRSH
jgi:putative PIN family toxin of toxin-antitoxin system